MRIKQIKKNGATISAIPICFFYCFFIALLGKLEKGNIILSSDLSFFKNMRQLNGSSIYSYDS